MYLTYLIYLWYISTVRLLSLNHQLQTKDIIHGFCVPTKNYYETIELGKALDKQTSYLRGLSSSSLSGHISPNTIYLIVLILCYDLPSKGRCSWGFKFTILKTFILDDLYDKEKSNHFHNCGINVPQTTVRPNTNTF